MKLVPTKFFIRIPCITLSLICFLSFQIFATAENDSLYSKSILEVVTLKKAIQKNTAIILKIAQNAGNSSFNASNSVTPFIRILRGECSFFENQFESEFPIYSPNINDEFQIIQQEDNWYQVVLRDGREAWIIEDCIQRFDKTEEKKLGRLSTISNKNDQLEIANYVIDELRLQVKEAGVKMSKIRSSKKTMDADLKQLSILQKQISRYESLAESAHQLYILPEKNLVNYADFLNKISLDAEIQLGTSDFTMTRNESSQVSQKGIIGDFLINLDYKVNKSSQANLFAQNSSDIIQTPYSNSDIGGKYSGRFKNLKYHSGLTYSNYDDKFNTFNNYRRVGINLGAEQKLTKKTSIRTNYLLNANSYTDQVGIDYSNHSAIINARTILSPSKRLDISVRANAQVGEEDRRNFILLYPELKFSVRKLKRTSQYFINFQNYTFSTSGLRDASRLMIGIKKSVAKENKSSSSYLALSSKSFQNNPNFSYYQIDTRFSTNWSGRNATFFNSGFRANYYPNLSNLNFSDIQFSFGNSGTLFYNFSTFNRFFYSSDPLTNLLDVNLRTGLRIKGFSLGPSLSVHASISDEGFEIRQDGNFYRLGAYAEGRISLPYQINISLVSAYDYGYVYSQQFSFGDVNERHPTTFQFNSTISTSIITNVDLFFRLNMYIIDSDLSTTTSINPIEQHTRFTARFGARYRFN